MVQPTGGYASNLNKDEMSHRTNSDMIRCQIYTAKLPEKFRRYALQHSIFVCRRIYSHPKTMSPYFQWHKKSQITKSCMFLDAQYMCMEIIVKH